MKTDAEWDALVAENARLVEALNNVSSYAGFTVRMFDCVANPERLREALLNIERDARKAVHEQRPSKIDELAHQMMTNALEAGQIKEQHED